MILLCPFLHESSEYVQEIMIKTRQKIQTQNFTMLHKHSCIHLHNSPPHLTKTCRRKTITHTLQNQTHVTFSNRMAVCIFKLNSTELHVQHNVLLQDLFKLLLFHKFNEVSEISLERIWPFHFLTFKVREYLQIVSPSKKKKKKKRKNQHTLWGLSSHGLYLYYNCKN